MDPEGRHFTTAELDKMEANLASPTGVAEGPDPVDQPQSTLSAGKHFVRGAAASVERTLLGLKQLYKYMSSDDEGREAVNEEIKKLEEEYADSLGTGAGKVGEMAGVVAQFAGPQAAITAPARILPQVLVRGARAVTGVPGSVGRGAAEGAGFEATQPVQPSDVGNEDFLMGKGRRVAVGGTTGAGAAKVAKIITSPGPAVSPERGHVVKEANRLGIELTPAQRTGDITLSQFEEGLASRPGSAKVILDAREAQRKVLDKVAAKAIGQPKAAPDEATLAAAREAAAKGYEPLASIEKMSWDTKYIESLDQFVRTQSVKATGSKNAAEVAKRLKKGAGKWTGDDFLEELQGVRDMANGARKSGDVATTKQLNKLGEIMEDFAERRVMKLAKAGKVAPDAVAQMQHARTEYAKIHAIEAATEPVSGRVSALKYLTGEFKRNPASRGPSTSPVAEGLKDVGSVARVLKQTTPYIGSSGTAERIAGQQLVDATQGPLSAYRTAGPMAKNYLAAKYYMKYGGQPGMLGSRLTPNQNMMVRRLMPGMVIGGGEALTE